MEELSKNYILRKTDVDFDYINLTIDHVKAQNNELTISIHNKIPPDIMQRYIAFSVDAERNTPGLLQPGEESRISEQWIKDKYNQRKKDSLYFDVLILNDIDQIVGKLNSWGKRLGGPYFIFHMYVNEKYRSKGLGKLLLCQTIKTALASIADLTHFELQTRESNIAAQNVIAEVRFSIKNDK